MFTETEVRKLECKSSTDKTWTHAKTYFKNLLQKPTPKTSSPRSRPFKMTQEQGKAGLRAHTTSENPGARDYHSEGEGPEAAQLAPCPASAVV